MADLHSVPTCVLPAVILLFWADKTAQRKGEMRVAESLFERRWRLEHGNEAVPGRRDHFMNFLVEMDAVGYAMSVSGPLTCQSPASRVCMDDAALALQSRAGCEGTLE